MPFPDAFKKKMIDAKKKKPVTPDPSASYDAEAAGEEDEASASMAASGASGDIEEEEDASSDVPPELAKSGKVNPLKRWAFDKAAKAKAGTK